MINKELMAQIEAIDSAVKLAANLRPKNHKPTGKTRKETEEIIGKVVIMVQTKLIAYEALQAAVKLSKDNEWISNKALEIYDAALRGVTIDAT